MTFEITIDKAGRVVIPKPLRERLGLAEGSSLILTLEDNKITLRPAFKRGRLKQKHGLWTWSSGGAPFDLMEVLKKSRHARAKSMLESA